MARPDPAAPLPHETGVTAVQPIYCTDGPVLCRVRVWSDQQWLATPTESRPRRAKRVEGLGWVVAFPVENLN
jgi:hypothetical protein